MTLHYRDLFLSLRLPSLMVLWVLFIPPTSASGQTILTAEEMFQTHVVQFDDKEHVIGESVPTIRAIIESTLHQVIKVFPLTAVRIIVVPDPKRTIPNYGIGGYTPNANTVFIYLDLAFPDFPRVVSERLPATLVHEFHHCMRWRGPGYGRTLFEALITEGLAEHFALELLGAKHPWTNAFPRDNTAQFLALAQPEFDSTTYNHPQWFFRGDHTLPRWTGYTLGFRLVEAYKEQHPATLGFRLVEAYKEQHPGETAVTLVHMPARVFRPQ